MVYKLSTSCSRTVTRTYAQLSRAPSGGGILPPRWQRDDINAWGKLTTVTSFQKDDSHQSSQVKYWADWETYFTVSLAKLRAAEHQSSLLALIHWSTAIVGHSLGHFQGQRLSRYGNLYMFYSFHCKMNSCRTPKFCFDVIFLQWLNLQAFFSWPVYTLCLLTLDLRVLNEVTNRVIYNYTH